MKLLDKKFLKAGKVSQLIRHGESSLTDDKFTMLDVAVKTFEALLDDPKQGDTAQENLSKYVHLMISGLADNFHNTPETFVDWVLDNEDILAPFLSSDTGE